MTCRVNIASGAIFDPLNATVDMIEPAGIMHHLAMLARWGGNLMFPYSVLQHSLVVMDALENPAERIYGLIHDWPEALLGADIISPTKMLIHRDGADINARERQYLNLIYRRLDIPPATAEIASRVHIADMRARKTELRDVVANPAGIVCEAAPLRKSINYENWIVTLDRGQKALDACLYWQREAA